jgi:uncharacterized RDD family membrane protein YckC
MGETRYKTFWRRLGALVIDGFLFSVPNSSVPDVHRDSSVALVLFVSLAAASPVVYSTVMHAKCGQTVGKMATGVFVLDLSESRGPSWRQALKRDSISYGSVVACCALLLVSIWANGEAGRWAVIIFGFGYLFAIIAWFLGEILTTLTNSRRRSLHDLLAGTVVVKLNQLAPTEIESIRENLPSRRKVVQSSPERPPANTGW